MSPAASKSALDFALGLFFAYRLALIEKLFPFGKGYFNLGPSSFEVNTGGNQRVTALVDLPNQPPNLRRLQQKPPSPFWVGLKMRAGVPGIDMHFVQPNFVFLRSGECVLKRNI